MATLIDAFLLEIGLDASKVAEGSAEAEGALDRVGRAAQRADRSTAQTAKGLDQAADSVTKGFASRALAISRFLELVARPEALLRSHLENVAKATQPARLGLGEVGAQARRTGSSLESGALAGASGFTALAGAGLLAFGAIKAVQGVMETLSKSADRTVAEGVNAGSAGLPIRRYGGVVNALAATGLTSEQAAGSGLVGFQQTKESLNTISPNSGAIAAWAALGVTMDMTSDEAYRHLAQRFSTETASAATREGGTVGIDPGTAQALRKLGPNYDRAVAQGELNAPGPGDFAAALKYKAALKQIDQEWENFARIFVDDLGPGIINLLKGLGELVDLIHNPGAHIHKGWLGQYIENFLSGEGSAWHDSSGAGAGPAGFTGGALPSNAAEGIKFFMQKGLTQEQASGVVARMMAESGNGRDLNPNAVNPRSGAYGIAQALGSRKPAFLATGGDLHKQLELVWQEFQTTEAAAFAKIKAARTPHDTAMAMESYERAGEPAFTAQAAALADRVYAAVSAPASKPAPGTPAATHTVIGRDGKPYTLGPKDYAAYLRSLPKLHTIMGPGGKHYTLNDQDYASWGKAYDAGTEDAWFKRYWVKHPKPGSASPGPLSMLDENNPALAYYRSVQAGLRAARSSSTVHHHHHNTDNTIRDVSVHVQTRATDAHGTARATEDALRRTLLVGRANTGLA